MKHLLMVRPGETFTVFSSRTEECISVKTLSVVGPDIAVEVETESDHLGLSPGIRRGVQEE